VSLVCAIERTIQKDRTIEITEVIPIAGDLEDHLGKPLNPKITRLKTADSHKDSEREGLRIELHGGVYTKKKQRAIIEFLCPVGGEETEPESNKESNGERKKRAASEDGLKFIGYDQGGETDFDTLRLEWHTEHACEAEKEKRAHWGFFTWFLIM
jgi:autophagy-related protein 27